MSDDLTARISSLEAAVRDLTDLVRRMAGQPLHLRVCAECDEEFYSASRLRNTCSAYCEDQKRKQTYRESKRRNREKGRARKAA